MLDLTLYIQNYLCDQLEYIDKKNRLMNANKTICYFVHMDRYMFKEKNNKLKHKLLLYIIIYYLMSYSVGINNLLDKQKQIDNNNKRHLILTLCIVTFTHSNIQYNIYTNIFTNNSTPNYCYK